jgi:AAHS family 4-hydroxybenzoate transporter-like MFS transporter
MKRTLDVATFVDSQGIGTFQIRILLICFVIMTIDGFDAQAIGFVAPLISASWQIPKSDFGPVFALGLLGMAIGALLLGAVADHFGRKRIVIFCFGLFGVVTVAKAYAADTNSLALLQFLAGLGVGGAMPNAIALISEYSPGRRRGLMVTIASAGYSVGASGAGFMTARFAGPYGWQVVFVAGGVVALVLLPILAGALPESIRFLMLSDRRSAKVVDVLRKIDRNLPPADHLTLVSSDKKPEGIAVTHLFSGGRAGMTILLWLAFFLDLLVIYYMTSWLPVTIHSVGGISVEEAAVSAALFSIAGLFGTPVVGQLMDRFGAVRVLASTFLGAALCIATIGHATTSLPVLKSVVFLAGFCSVGAHLGLSALAGELYPTFMRSTGVGWALGIGRFGSLISPMLGGLLLSRQWPVNAIFYVVAVPALLASVTIILVGVLVQSTKRASHFLEEIAPNA